MPRSDAGVGPSSPSSPATPARRPTLSRKALATYEAKRDFGKTSEPRGGRCREGRKAEGLRFVVQKHDARRLHYDFRLELDGVLKSWAVTRGPSLVAGERRLAVETEDHPLSYLDFEGFIPKGQYGGGTVIVWDIGAWRPEGDPHAGLKDGKLTFTLDGQRLKGRWHLIRTKPRSGRNQWLLIKSHDEAAREPDAPDVLEEENGSVLSGRTNADLEAAGTLRADHAARETIARRDEARAVAPPAGKKALLPLFVEPCLATPVAAAPDGPGWLYEIKFDGYRLQARIDGRDVKLLTRSGLDWTEKFRPLASALRRLDLPSALIDGELVVEDAAGLSDFSALQAALKAGRADRLVYYVFDLLYLDGRDLRPLPLRERKAALAALLEGREIEGVRLSEHVEEEGEAMVRHACRLGLEGVVAKRADRPYRSGRAGDWLKVKCTARQELVVGGYTPSTATKRAVGSLVLGAHEGKRLVHVGRSGTGFSAEVARDLWKTLEAIQAPEPPFAGRLPVEALRGGPRWVEPRLVAEVELRGWTADGHVRQAAFRGLRDDKDAAEVKREGPVGESKGRRRPSAASAVKLTHPDRVLWDDVGLTKEGLAAFYAEIADRILSQVAGRPLALVRGPDGASGKTFFQKHGGAGLDDKYVEHLRLGDDDALAIRDLDGLLALVQASVLEIHPWGARLDDPDRPDRIVFDLDPGDGVGWAEVVGAAGAVRERLGAEGHESFVKTTGGKGLHVVVPLRPRASWDEVKDFARGIAAAMAADEPKRFTDALAKRARPRRIFVDYLRNGRGSTAVAAYSTRARPGAPVATPLAWEELSGVPSGSYFRVDTVLRRLDELEHNPWADMDAAARPLETKTGGSKTPSIRSRR